MFRGGSWWILVNLGGSWLFLVVLGCFWWSLMILYGSLWCFVVLYGSRWFLVVLGVSCWFLLDLPALALGRGPSLGVVELLQDDDLHRPIQSELVLEEVKMSSSRPVITCRS